MEAKLQENSTRYEGEIQRLLRQLETLSHSSRHRQRAQTADQRAISSMASTSSSSSSTSSTTDRRLARGKDCGPNPTSGSPFPALGPGLGPGLSPGAGPGLEGLCSSSEEALHLLAREQFLPEGHREASPVDSVATRFLEDEGQRSQELLLRLDAHIQGMREDNARTISKYLGPAGTGLDQRPPGTGQ